MGAFGDDTGYRPDFMGCRPTPGREQFFLGGAGSVGDGAEDRPVGDGAADHAGSVGYAVKFQLVPVGNASSCGGRAQRADLSEIAAPEVSEAKGLAAVAPCNMVARAATGRALRADPRGAGPRKT